MRSINEREKALNMYFLEGKGHKRVAKEMNLPVNTIKSWVRRHKDQNDTERLSNVSIKVKKEYKPRTKTPEKTAEERIAQLEMEVELLRNFLLEEERRSIKN